MRRYRTKYCPTSEVTSKISYVLRFSSVDNSLEVLPEHTSMERDRGLIQVRSTSENSSYLASITDSGQILHVKEYKLGMVGRISDALDITLKRLGTNLKLCYRTYIERDIACGLMIYTWQTSSLPHSIRTF
jgi:hypothetical protein